MKTLSTIALAFSGFTVAVLLGQAAAAYPVIRSGCLGLIGLLVVGCIAVGIWSLIDMFRSHGYLGNRAAVALLPAIGLAIVLGFAVLLGVLVG